MTQPPPTPAGAAQTSPIETLAPSQPQNTMLDYTYASTRFRKLVENWRSGEQKVTERNRRLRDIKVDVAALRANKKLKSDETYIPIRMLDLNIRREQPPFIQYLTQSRRTAIFSCSSQPGMNTEQLEKEFTRVTRAPGWLTPFLQTLDGASLHGWDSVEVEFNEGAESQFIVDHVGHENLLFPGDAQRLQNCEYIIRVRHVTLPQLRAFVSKYGFNKLEVEELAKKLDSESGVSERSEQGDSVTCVYKAWMKVDGIVHVCWYHPDASDWLKAPEPLFIGRKQQQEVVVASEQPDPMTGMMMPMQQVQQQWVRVAETEYPIEILFYQEGEKPEITAHYGRAHLDEYKQEGASAVWSSFINGCNRAANVFGAPKQITDTAGVEPKQTDVVLEHGKMYNAPMEFFNMPYPDPIMLKAAQQLDTQNATETNQVAWAVNNRQDSRKTATEIDAAQQQTANINSVTVTLFSQFVANVYTRGWLILQSRVQQGLAKLFVAPEIVGHTYVLKAAGDVDVIERAEKLQRQMQMWPVVQSTGAAMVFLSDILQTAFPEDAPKYIQAIQAAQMKNQLIQKLSSALQATVVGEDGKIDPQFAGMEGQLAQLAQETQQALATP